MPYTDILIAVHGIGDQQHSATVRSVATRFAGSEALRPGGFAPQPLGYFHTDVRDTIKVAPLARAESLHPPLNGIGFAEVFWADIPQDVVKEGRTLEEIKAWGQTIVARARAVYKAREKDGGILRPDFSLAAEVIDEIVETIQVLENLSWIAEKAGIGRFDMRELLDEYVGDVQVVTEFALFRRDIIGRFHRALQQVHEADVKEKAELAQKNGGPPAPPARLHIVAHSEGTVVAFLGLLHALSGQTFDPANLARSDADSTRLLALLKQLGFDVKAGESPTTAAPKKADAEKIPPPHDAAVSRATAPPAWLGHVHGFMTLGSPIDKHLLLWEELGRGFDLSQSRDLFRNHRIRWRNYYDRGDPVGFELDTARRWLQRAGDVAFEFCNCPDCRHDVGFSRYMLPGKAHNDYWDDPDVFDHFIRDVVLRPAAPPGPSAFPPPRDKWGPQRISPCMPYVFGALLLAAGTYFLYSAVTQFTHPQFDLLRRYIEYSVGGLELPKQKAAVGFELVRNSLGLAGLIGGVTIAARLPRLALGMWPRAVIAWLSGAALYCLLVPGDSRAAIGPKIEFLGQTGATVGVLLVSLVVVAIGLTGTTRPRQRGFAGVMERRQRWLRRGARPLIFVGSVAIALFVLRQMLGYEVREISALKIADYAVRQQAQALISAPPSFWPVIVAGGAFLYLWWLATLIFDLAFVWNRYIRGGVALQRLRDWNSLGLPEEPPGKCRYRDLPASPPAAGPA